MPPSSIYNIMIWGNIDIVQGLKRRNYLSFWGKSEGFQIKKLLMNCFSSGAAFDM